MTPEDRDAAMREGEDGPFCYCGHGPDSHKTFANGAWCEGCEFGDGAAPNGDEDDEPTDANHAYEAVTDAEGRDLPLS